MSTENKAKFPFSEGDDYYTIDGADVVWSCWDDISEELHYEGKLYFATKEQAEAYLKSKHTDK